jgi:hypothetical protein
MVADRNRKERSMAKKSTSKKSSKTKEKTQGTRSRRTVLFPAASFEESLTIANAIQKHAAGQKVRRLTLFDQMERSPDSSASRMLIVNSNKYGLTKGNYSAEYLEITTDGKLATSSDTATRDMLKARFKLAIEQVSSFKALYDAQKGNRLPANSVLEDFVKENGIPDSDAKECVEIFIVNAKYLGILKPIAGAERIIPLEQALEELPTKPLDDKLEEKGVPSDSAKDPIKSKATEATQDWGKTCFYISPIGEDETEHRNHADLFLGSIVEPALEEFKLSVIRADKIGKAG